MSASGLLTVLGVSLLVGLVAATPWVVSQFAPSDAAGPDAQGGSGADGSGPSVTPASGGGPGPDVMGGEFLIDSKAGREHRIPDANWHAATGQFLIVWSELPDAVGNDEIRARLVNLDGSLAGGDYVLSAGGGEQKDFPQVAHIANTNNLAQQLSLVVFMDDRDGGDDIWGQLIAPAGNAVSGGNFKISGGDDDLFPELAYGQIDPNNGRFLVAWQREVGADDSEVYGRVIRGATNAGGNPGDLIGGSFAISTAAAGLASAPSVAFDPINDQFLVVWRNDPDTTDEEADIYGQLVSTGGALVGGNFQISSQSGLEYAPGAVYHPEQQEFLVLWNRDPAGAVDETDVHGQRVSPAGALLGGVIDIAATADQEEFGNFAIDVDTGSYVVPLTTGPNLVTRNHVEMQKVSATGALIGGRTAVATDVVANKGPATAVYGSTVVGPGAGVSATSEVLVSWRDFRSGTYDAYGRLVEVLTDTDGDALPDVWETGGYVDMNDNGVLDGGDFDFTTLLAADQPNVNRKDLYVEVDWMQVDADGDGLVVADPDSPGDHTHTVIVTPTVPTGTGLDAVITSFANAPVANPDGSTGITLHLDVGQMGGGGAIPETAGADFAAGFEAVKTANFAANRERVFRYGLLKHNDGGAGGRGEIWGNDFWVDGAQNTQVTQTVTFMHEFGHTLGLRHGGADNVNCKPNYLSIMSYTLSGTGLQPTGRFDYSSQNLAALNEATLSEVAPLGDANDHTGDGIEQTIFSMGGAAIGPNAATAGNVGINWDNDGTPGEVNDGVLPEPVGNTNINNPPGFGCGASPANEVLNGFDDWANLRYNWHGSPHVDDNIHVYHDEDDLPAAVKVSTQAHYGDPSPSLSKTGTAAGIPGDAVSYTVEIGNGGPGPVRNLLVEDAWPAGLTFTGASASPAVNTLNPDSSRALVWFFQDILQAGETLSITLDGTIDFPPIADFVTNSVTLAGQDILGEPQPVLLRSVVTDIQFPEIEVTKTATAAVNAGEAIAITLDYVNVGDADAVNVVLVDTLPAELAYVAASGLPAPDSAVVNADQTTTLTWSVGTVAPGGGGLITFAARPSLLLVAPDLLTNEVEVSFEDANGNVYPAAMDTADTALTEVPPTEDMHPLGWWKNHQGGITDEILAMIQATDTRYDLDGDGHLNGAEGDAALQGTRPQDRVSHLRSQLFATYLNLATRAFNAGTVLPDSLDGKIAKLGLDFANVREAALFARDVLSLPLDASTDYLYVKAYTVLAEVNTNWVFAGP